MFSGSPSTLMYNNIFYNEHIQFDSSPYVLIEIYLLIAYDLVAYYNKEKGINSFG